jgi:hypothetical protein
VRLAQYVDGRVVLGDPTAPALARPADADPAPLHQAQARLEAVLEPLRPHLLVVEGVTHEVGPLEQQLLPEQVLGVLVLVAELGRVDAVQAEEREVQGRDVVENDDAATRGPAIEGDHMVSKVCMVLITVTRMRPEFQVI